MNIQEHLDAFDGWLTSRIAEAHAVRKDLAFRDLTPEIRLGANAWEYSLIEPGQVVADGEGWSVYRLQGVWPEFTQMEGGPSAGVGERRSILTTIADAVLGRDSRRR